MNGLELKLSYLHYLDGNINEMIKCLNNYYNRFLYNNLIIDKDPFWNSFAKHVFIAVISNKFNKGIEMEKNNIYELFSDSNMVFKEVKEFCIVFNGYSCINFIPYLQKITEKMISGALDIIQTGIKNNQNL